MHKAINRYELKHGTTFEDIAKELKDRNLPYNEGGLWVNKEAKHVFWRTLMDDITVNIAFPEDLTKWDDFDYILVMDDSFGQPYTPFYDCNKPFPYLLNIIGLYNKFMDSLDFLERSNI